MKHTLILICTVLWTGIMMAQFPEKADKLFVAGDYEAAIQEYQMLLRTAPKYPLYNYRYARCSMEMGDFTTAIPYFLKSGDKYPLTNYFLGECYLQLWYTDQAIEAYQAYIDSQKQGSDRIQEVQSKIRYAELLRRYLKRVERVILLDSIAVNKDSMLNAITLSPEAGNLFWDKQHIVYENQRKDRMIYCVSGDSTRQVLVSQQRLMNEWEKADTLPNNLQIGSIQQNPFLLTDGLTLYYASNDSNGIGGLDIYVSRYNTAHNAYTTPENIGMPFNSPDNEYLFAVDESRGIGYLVSDRGCDSNKVKVYALQLNTQKTYWHHLSQDSLVAYAQLTDWISADRVPDTPATAAEQPIVEEKEEKEDFCWVVNDSVTYHHLSDFPTIAQKEAFLVWQQKATQLERKCNELSALREKFYLADVETQQQLTPTILQLESEVETLRLESQEAKVNVRRLEIGDWRL